MYISAGSGIDLGRPADEMAQRLLLSEWYVGTSR